MRGTSHARSALAFVLAAKASWDDFMRANADQPSARYPRARQLAAYNRLRLTGEALMKACEDIAGEAEEAPAPASDLAPPAPHGHHFGSW